MLQSHWSGRRNVIAIKHRRVIIIIIVVVVVVAINIIVRIRWIRQVQLVQLKCIWVIRWRCQCIWVPRSTSERAQALTT